MALIRINTNVWVTQAEYLRLHPHVTAQQLNGWIKRDKVAFWYIAHLGITLVKK
jgi:hypothetical protein